MLSNRAHAYEKIAIRDKNPKILEDALEDCDMVTLLAGSKGHFRTSLLRARIFLNQELHDDAVRACKNAASAAQGIDEWTKAMDLLDQAMAARILARRKADEKERQDAEARKKQAAENARVQQVLDKFDSMDSWEILGLHYGATPSQVKTAYRKLAMKYHPDRPEGSK
ncbi:hypothetical protein DL93DRAFT_2072961 [Clavulina sp. PMI_390]|nr:hypothetical protein DL93DRAFT_2072961 [Clavulina sp. PMI_390]